MKCSDPNCVTLLALYGHVEWLYSDLIPRILLEITQHVCCRASCCYSLYGKVYMMVFPMHIGHVFSGVWEDTVLDVVTLNVSV